MFGEPLEGIFEVTRQASSQGQAEATFPDADTKVGLKKKNDSHHPHLVHSNCALYFYITAVTSTSAPPAMRRRVSFPGTLCAFTATVMQRRGGIVTLPVLTACITAGETMTEHRGHPGSFRVSQSPGTPVDAKLN